jgi:hypothetical protein
MPGSDFFPSSGIYTVLTYWKSVTEKQKMMDGETGIYVLI